MFAEGILFLKNRIASPVVDCAKSYCQKVAGLSGSPRNIARGVALGLAFDFLPIPVISIPLSYLAAKLTRCHPVATVATVIAFKLAVPFFYALNIIVGNAIVGDLAGPQIATSGIPLVGAFLELIVDHGYPFLVGSMVNAALAWLAVSLLLTWLLKRRQSR